MEAHAIKNHWLISDIFFVQRTFVSEREKERERVLKEVEGTVFNDGLHLI